MNTNTTPNLEYLRKKVYLPGITDPRDASCGNRHIDELAARGRMNDVWNLLNRFPLIKANEYTIWVLRRRGDIRHMIEGCPEYASLRTEFGPQTRDEWELLAKACLRACGYTATTEELYTTYRDVGAPWDNRSH